MQGPERLNMDYREQGIMTATSVLERAVAECCWRLGQSRGEALEALRLVADRLATLDSECPAYLRPVNID